MYRKLIANYMSLQNDSNKNHLQHAISIIQKVEDKCSSQKTSVPIKAFKRALVELHEKLDDAKGAFSSEEKTVKSNLRRAAALPILNLAKTIEFFSDPLNKKVTSQEDAMKIMKWHQKGLKALVTLMKITGRSIESVRLGLPTVIKLGFDTLANIADEYLMISTDKLHQNNKKILAHKTRLTKMKAEIQQKQINLKKELQDIVDFAPEGPQKENDIERIRNNIELNANKISAIRIKIDQAIAKSLSINAANFSLGMISGIFHGASIGLGSMGYLFMAPDIIIGNFFTETIKVYDHVMHHMVKPTEISETIQHDLKDTSKNLSYDLGKNVGTMIGLVSAAMFVGGPLFEDIFKNIEHSAHGIKEIQENLHTIEGILHNLKFVAVLYGEITFKAIENLIIIANSPQIAREVIATAVEHHLENKLEKMKQEKIEQHEKRVKEFMEKFRNTLRVDHPLDKNIEQ